MISDFFSKFDRFEGQCQRRPPKGSPSSPVIFHRTWYWKWSISTQGGQVFGPWDQISGLSGLSAHLLRICRSVRKSGNLVPGPIRPSEPEIGSGRQKSDLAAKVPKSGNPGKSWKSRISHKSRLFRKSRDFCEILDFRIGQDSGHSAQTLCTWCQMSLLCVHTAVRNSVRHHMHCTFERATTHWHTSFVSKANSWHASILYSIARFWTIVRFENNFWNK